jgi:endonuclease/exonuclease/phosphatase (EEP) superfamily protein YafD
MKIIRYLLIAISAIYALGLATYLILRVAFGDGWWWLALLNNFAPFYFLPLFILLPLALLFRARRMVFLLPLALIGLLWFGPYFLPKQHVTASGTALKVLTFNVWGENRHLDEVEAWLREMDADIVLMQEIPPSYGAGGVPSLLDVYPHQFAQPPEMREWGNVVLSRYPLLTMDYLDTEGDGTPTQQRVTFDLEGQTIAIYNVHFLMPVGEYARVSLPFDNPFANLALKYDHSARNAQIQRVLDFLDDETLPYIMAGDFNMSDQTMMYGELAARMGDSFREAVTGFGTSWPVSAMEEFPTLPDFLPAVIRIDYIWHSDQFRAVEAQQGPPLGSDHLALFAMLEFSPAG